MNGVKHNAVGRAPTDAAERRSVDFATLVGLLPISVVLFGLFGAAVLLAVLQSLGYAPWFGIDTFPDVSIVWSHRNPLVCTASICSMTHALMEGKIEFEKSALGPVVMDFYATSLERGLAARDRRDSARFIDVTHDEFVARPMDVAAKIYGHFGLPFTASVRSALEAHTMANPKGRHGAHEYSLDDWGLTKEQVRERFAPYAERFGIEMD